MRRVSDFLRAELPGLAKRNRPSLALIAVLVSLVLALQAVVGAGVAHYAQASEQDSALSLIELSGVSAQATKDLTEQTLRPITSVQDVVGVYPWWQRDLALTNASDWPQEDLNPGALWATPLIPGLDPEIVEGTLPTTGLEPGEVVLPRDVPGGSLVPLLGKTITFDYTKVTGQGTGEAAQLPLKVVAIADNSVPGRDGPTPAFISGQDLTLISGGTDPLTFTTAFVKVASSEDVPEVQAELSRQGFAVSSLASQMSDLGGLFDVLRSAGWIILVVLGLICLTVGAAVGSIWVRQRTRDIGVLKAIGWSRGMVASSIASELAFVGVFAAVVGLGVGIVVSLVATTIVANADLVLLPVEPFQVPPWQSLLTVGVLVPVCVVVGGLPQATRAARVDPDDVIRGA